MKHSERSLQNSVWPSPVGLSRPIPADSPHHSLQHWPSFSVPDFRALCVLFPFPVMLVPPPPSLGLMDSYSSFMLLLKCLQLRPLQPCQTKSDCSVKYSHNSLYLLGAHHNCWFHIFWSYSVQGFSPCTLRGESCIETGAYIVGTQNCRVNEGRFLPFLYVGFIPSLFSLNTFSRDDSLVFFWNMWILTVQWMKKETPRSLNTRSSPPSVPVHLQPLAHFPRVMCRVSLVFWSLLCLQPVHRPVFLPRARNSSLPVSCPSVIWTRLLSNRCLVSPGSGASPGEAAKRVCWEQAVRSERPRVYSQVPHFLVVWL